MSLWGSPECNAKQSLVPNLNGITYPSSSSADTEELVHRARAVMGPTVKSSG